MNDETMLIAGAAIIAGLALSGGLNSVGVGVQDIGQSVGTGVNNVTGIIPFAENQLLGFENWVRSVL